MKRENIKRRTGNLFLRFLPVLMIVLVTWSLFAVMYNRMIRSETQACWERLDVALKSMEEKIRVHFEGSINTLELASDSVVLKNELLDETCVAEYLADVRATTIYERIAILFPDGRMLMDTGETLTVKDGLSYEELQDRGTHFSPRLTDQMNGKEIMHCCTPIVVDGSSEAFLIGTLDCNELAEVFDLFSYNGQAQIFLIDCEDGNFLIDNWHEKLGNVEEWKDKQMAEGYEDVPIVSELLNGKVGQMSFVSETNGKLSYMSYMPVEGFDWELCVAVQEDMALEHLEVVQNSLRMFGIVEAVLLLVYVIWNVVVILMAVANEERVQKLELEKVTNDAKSRFLSNMSHDIRTPLNGIVGMLNIIKAHKDDEALVEDCLRKIDISTKYLSTLTNDMLDINELENGNIQILTEPVDLRRFMDEIDSIIQPKAKDAGVTCTIDCRSIEHPYVMGSAVHMQRILLNLIGNAIKYCGDGGRVWVTAEEMEHDSQNASYRFEVRDNGIGMTEEFQKKMFNMFEQEEKNPRSRYQGYGLGLTIVQQLVDKMNGTIQIRSKKGEGSNFIVILPMKYTKEPIAVEEKKEINLSGMKILVAEDNELNMEIAEVLLSDAGAVITKASNGKIAVDLFAKQPPGTFDLILMDIMMPEMDGYEATQTIRAMERPDAKVIPIVAMTASAFSEERARCLEIGMNDHIGKPLDIDKLLRKLAHYYQ